MIANIKINRNQDLNNTKLKCVFQKSKNSLSKYVILKFPKFSNKFSKNNNSNNILYNNNYYRNGILKINICFLLWNFIIINFINIIFTEQSISNATNNLTNFINLKIEGNEIELIFLEPSEFPYLLYVNGNITEIDFGGYIDFFNDEEINNITLVFNHSLKTCKYLFENFWNAIEIDLSHFDTSFVTSMEGMFYNCYNLKYINFNNINTSSVSDMSYLFHFCTSLTSLNLSSFDTSKVTTMEYMFAECEVLESIYLGNFKTSKLLNINSMFSGCCSLTTINLSSFNTSTVTDMTSLFSFCNSLKGLNLYNFNTSNVNSMSNMFMNCELLHFINLSSFDTSNVKYMKNMFNNAQSLISIDLSIFNTNFVKSMGNMFYNCYSLISLDLSNFTFNFTDMDYFFWNCNSLVYVKFPDKNIIPTSIEGMFEGCFLLTSLYLVNFDFSLVSSFNNLFYNCQSLTSLDLSNRKVFSCIDMSNMFSGCSSLKILNLTNFYATNVEKMDYMFYKCYSLLYIDISNLNTSNVYNMTKIFYDCSKLISLNLGNFQTSLITDMESMFFGCYSLLSLNVSSFDTFQVTNMKDMFYGCRKLTSLDLSNFNIVNVTNMNFMFALCTHLKYINFGNFNIKLKDMKGIFFGTDKNLIVSINNEDNKQILLSGLSSSNCIFINDTVNIDVKKLKIIPDKQICVEDCKKDKIYKYEYEYVCYINCPVNTHSVIEDQYLCKKDIIECLEIYPFLNVEEHTCERKCNSEDFFNKICTFNNNNSSKKIIINNIINEVEDGTLDNLLLDIIYNDKKDKIIKESNITFQLTSTYNQNNNDYQNLSVINFGECETIIKEQYNILRNESLIIFKIEQKVENLLIPKIEYEIFNPLTNERLELNECKNLNLKIEIKIPAIINEDKLYIYDLNSSFYNDICNITSLENNIDLTLYNRKECYKKNYLWLCPYNCIYKGYISDKKKAICQCKVQNGIKFFPINYIELLEKDFRNYKRISNLDIMKCYNILFSLKGLIKNSGNYILMLIIILYIISAIIFYKKEYNLLCNKINEILDFKNSQNETNVSKNLKILEKSKNISLDSFISKKNYNKNNISENYTYKSNLKIQNLNLSDIQIISKNDNNNIKFTDYEINIIGYEEALQFDKRTFMQYYISLLKTNHLFIFSFIPYKDYNPYIIKLCLFFFSFALYLTINALFFNDSKMYQIFKENGKFNVASNIPQIIYCLIICSIFNNIMKKIFLSQNDILGIKQEKNIYNIKGKVITVIKCLIIKYILFFVLGIIILSTFWYYLSCFCLLYKNTQIYLYKITLYPFIICFLAAIFRISSIKQPGKCLYNISQNIFLL